MVLVGVRVTLGIGVTDGMVVADGTNELVGEGRLVRVWVGVLLTPPLTKNWTLIRPI